MHIVNINVIPKMAVFQLFKAIIVLIFTMTVIVIIAFKVSEVPTYKKLNVKYRSFKLLDEYEHVYFGWVIKYYL